MQYTPTVFCEVPRHCVYTLPSLDSLAAARGLLTNRTSMAGIWVTEDLWLPWHRVTHIEIIENEYCGA